MSRTVTILRPDVDTKDKRKPWLLTDGDAEIRMTSNYTDAGVEDRAARIIERWYVTVPLAELHGSWKVRDLIPPEQLAALARLTNRMEKASHSVARKSESVLLTEV